MRKRWRCWLLVTPMFVLIAVVLAGCAHSNTGTSVVVEVKDNGYTPTTLEVPAGVSVKLTLKNTDTMEHQLGIKDIALLTSGGGMSGMAGMQGNMGEQLQLHIVAAAGAQNTLDFTPTQPDRYEFFCPVPGHTERGTLIVKG